LTGWPPRRSLGAKDPEELPTGFPATLRRAMTSSSSPKKTVTVLLQAWGRGDRTALDALVPLIYGELRRKAGWYMRQQPVGHTLQTTDLVHEAFLRLVDQPAVDWQGRGQFYTVAAKAMRSILVDHARARGAVKRGRGGRQVTLGAADEARATQPAIDVLELDEALRRLAELDPEQCRLVELRYFAGLSIEEVAEALGTSPATVKRQWRVARAWLNRELTGG
jgi:RNA polymerase sigma factor (TIGR02999 family)